MEKPKASKQQLTIILISSVAFLLILGKHVIAPAVFSSSVLMIELLASLAILLLVYYADRSIKRYNLAIAKSEEQNKHLLNTITKLKQEIDSYQQSKEKNDTIKHPFENIDLLFRNLPAYSNKQLFCASVLSIIANHCELIIGLFFTYHEQTQNFCVEGYYGLEEGQEIQPFVSGEGLHGEAVKTNQIMVLEELPEDYFKAYSGLGECLPKYLYILPLSNEGEVIGLIELASFKPLYITEYWDQLNAKLVGLARSK